jgi:hypothetical protein
VQIATVIKVAVAARLLLDSRAIPQTPCPLVHPFPRRVPTPTRIPAIKREGRLMGKAPGIQAGFICLNTAADIRIPSMNAAEQSLLLGASDTRLLTIPLTPRILPLKYISKIADRPINNPPTEAKTYELSTTFPPLKSLVRINMRVF